MRIRISDLRQMIREATRRIVVPKWQAEREAIEDQLPPYMNLDAMDPLERIGFKKGKSDRRGLKRDAIYWHPYHKTELKIFSEPRSLRFQLDRGGRPRDLYFSDLQSGADALEKYFKKSELRQTRDNLKLAVDVNGTPFDQGTMGEFREAYPNGDALDLSLWANTAMSIFKKKNSTIRYVTPRIRKAFSDLTGYDRIETSEEARDAIKMIPQGSEFEVFIEFLLPAAVAIENEE